MEHDTRRMVTAMLAAMAVLLGYQIIFNQIFPPPEPPAATQPAATQSVDHTPAPTTTGQAPSTTPSTSPQVKLPPRRDFAFEAAEPTNGDIVLGGTSGDALRLRLSPYGAAVSSIELFRKNEDGRFVHRVAADSEEPYQLISPIKADSRTYHSFATHRIWVEEVTGAPDGWTLDTLPWVVVETTDHTAVFRLTLGGDGGELLEITKSYDLDPTKPILDVMLQVKNLSKTPLTVRLKQDGPIGITREHFQYDMRYLLLAQIREGMLDLNKAQQHSALQSATRTGEPVRMDKPDLGPIVWTALTNKYFGVFTRPVPRSAEYQDFIKGATGDVAAAMAPDNPGDLRARLTIAPTTIQPGESTTFPFEIYAGAKDSESLKRVDPKYADSTGLYYQLAQSADTRCSCCTFGWLRELMTWLLEKIYFIVRNYGIAIMILVVIIRGLLHPLTVFQQKSMFKMQESMSRIQPKLNALKEKYKDDKVKQNQEMMRLFGEEGVNPMSNFVSFLPLFLQMPILVALWTALNTDVHLRHAPFDGWWIEDLSAPDAIYSFDRPFHVPLLSWIPFIGPIASINLLPILMGVSMWLQQKYMPKPHMKAKLDAAKKQQTEGHKPSGMSPEDQMRQQQMIAYMMAIMFPLMFYKMPAGLNLYWLSTNIFGICESLIIRRQIDREKKQREESGMPPPKKIGFVSRFFKRVAQQAEELQKKADEISKEESKRKDKKGKGKK